MSDETIPAAAAPFVAAAEAAEKRGFYGAAERAQAASAALKAW
jgi:hypothetical protein